MANIIPSVLVSIIEDPLYADKLTTKPLSLEITDPKDNSKDSSKETMQTATPPPSNSGYSSPTLLNDEPEGEECELASAPKKKKKKKPKKSAKARTQGKSEEQEPAPSALCISRNKHWKYISSYHGPWLQLPTELLESLLILNMDPATLQASEPSDSPNMISPPSTAFSSRSGASPPSPHPRTSRSRELSLLSDSSPGFSSSDIAQMDHSRLYYPLFSHQPGKPTPPPIDPGVFRCVTTIRRLIDEAADLAVRASSGLSAAALGAMRGNGNGIGSMGSPLLGENMNNGGRNVAMSPTRIHRLRVMAVQKLSQAYKHDEVASSVMIMQGGSVFDDIAERVLKVDPHDLDAKYVQFFHEKIPTRQLAEYTTTQVLDELIAAQPQRLEFYRTRGIVRCFRDEYGHAVRDFTYALKESRAMRKARQAHNSSESDHRESYSSKGNKKKKGGGQGRGRGGASEQASGLHGAQTPPTVESSDGEPLLLHPAVLPDAPDPIEAQLLFLRASTFLQHAISLIEESILRLEGVSKTPQAEGAELRLCQIENGRYGGVEVGNPAGPLGPRDGPKARAYNAIFTEPAFFEQVCTLLRKSIRDHERFLSHFDTLEGPVDPMALDVADDIVKQIEVAFLLTDALRTGDHSSLPQHLPFPMTFTTYHPLIFESQYSILICLLMLGDFSRLLPTLIRTAAVVDGLEGYPVFLPPRSMAQAEFVEVLERLAGGWRVGVLPHLRVRLPAVEAAIPSASLSPVPGNFGSGGGASSEGVSSAAPSPGPSRSSTMYSMDESLGRTSPDHDLEDADRRNYLLASLDSIRLLLAPVAKRQRERAAQSKLGGEGKQRFINIPLHGPRVEIVLAWLGATHLAELETVA